MYGGVTMTGPVGATIVLPLAMSMVVSLWLANIAVVRTLRSPLSIAAALTVAAAMVCNGVGGMWSINALRWSVIPLQVIATAAAYFALRQHRPAAAVSAGDDPAHTGS